MAKGKGALGLDPAHLSGRGGWEGRDGDSLLRMAVMMRERNKRRREEAQVCRLCCWKLEPNRRHCDMATRKAACDGHDWLASLPLGAYARMLHRTKPLS